MTTASMATSPDLETVSTVELLEELKRRYACLAKPEGRYIFMGAPGSGKGTQSLRLKKSHCLCHLSTGDMLREAVAQNSELGKKAKAVMDAGELVSDDIVLDLIGEKIRSHRCRRGFILDGFPRNPSQAKSLDKLLADARQKLDGVLYFEAPDDVLIDRAVDRLVHPPSGRVYNTKTQPPLRAGLDDVTGEPLVHRKDDNAETLRKRVNIFHQQTLPVIQYYSQQGLLQKMNAAQECDAVTKNMYDFVSQRSKKVFDR